MSAKEFKLKIRPGKSLLKGGSSSVAMQPVSVLSQRAQNAGLPCLRHSRTANKHFFAFCVGNNTPLCSKSSLWTKRRNDTYINNAKNLLLLQQKNLNGLIQESLINLQFKNVDVVIAGEGRPVM